MALVAAALLVVYLQQRARQQQHKQTELILQQVCDRTAVVLAGRIRELFDGAVPDTIEGIGHPELRANDLTRFASFFSTGLDRYPYVDRFFIWNTKISNAVRDQVLFFAPRAGSGTAVVEIFGSNKAPLGSLVADEALGRRIMELAREAAALRKSFAVVDTSVDGVKYQVILHTLFDDERRTSFFSVIGYTVNPRRVETQLFQKIAEAELRRAVNTNPRSPRLALTVFDDSRQPIWGPAVVAGVPSATVPIDMLFFPGEAFKSFLSVRPPPRIWYVTVSVASPVLAAGSDGLPLFAAALGLIFIALFCGVTIDREATRLETMQTDFVAHVSHQLKTPLSLLSSAAETLRLQRVSSPEKVREYLGILSTQTSRLSGLVDKILQFSRMQGGQPHREFVETDVVELVDRAIQGFQSALPETLRSIQFEPTDHNVHVQGDPASLEVAITNLLENALKYSNGREVTVSVDSAGDEALVRVRDRGVGIDPADLPYIFERFYSGHNNYGHRRSFGLGLSIVRGIVTMHGGRVDVQSQPEEGAVFRVFLPLAYAAAGNARVYSRR